MSSKISVKTFLLHTLMWLIIWVTFAFFLGGAEYFTKALTRSTYMIVGQIILVYWNTEFLLPKYFHTKKYWIYTVIVILSVLLVSFLTDQITEFVHHATEEGGRKNRGGRKGLFYIMRLFPYFLAIALSNFYKVTMIANEREKEAARLKSEQLDTEMKLLKSQINPHFLFNVLNNIYTLSIIKSDQTPEYLLKFSDILRYVLYECNADTVPLSKEITYLKDYTDLQLLKDKGLRVDIELDDRPTALMIAPMLLLPFIENAFKHSKIENLEEGWIKILLKIEEKTILFSVQNSLPKTPFTKDKVGGIGLKNVQRRLEVHYPEKHTLEIETLTSAYHVNLTIDLTS